MYIEYYQKQKSLDIEDRTNYRLSLTGGDYRPVWLVRVSDWKKVPGEEAFNGYHTLSYCWEQSGKVVKRNDGSGEYDCIDRGRHCIIEHVKERKARNFFRRTVKKHVTYEELLQQVCKDFQIEYLWYDKVCIDQLDTKSKLQEIKEMHKVYRNARYTIAMVPEVWHCGLKCLDKEDFQYGTWNRFVAVTSLTDSCWMRRSWTLEELMMSKRILMIGTNTSMFQHSLLMTDVPTTVDNLSSILLDFGGENREKGSINQALSQAHFRTSTKPHDMLLALGIIFPHIFDDIDIDYDTDIKTTFNNVYRTTAARDLSILCFGSVLMRNGSFDYYSTISNYNLPSWTGVAGCHVSHSTDSTTHLSLMYKINPDDMRMYVKTSCYWDISITPYESGCYSSSIIKKYTTNTFCCRDRRITAARFRGQWTNMATADKSTILQEWDLDISLAGRFMTHCHQRSPGSLSQIRPLSLTEDCRTCIVLPILLKSRLPIYGAEVECTCVCYRNNYFLPVFRKTIDGTGRYKAIGIYFVGNELKNSESPTLNLRHCNTGYRMLGLVHDIYLIVYYHLVIRMGMIRGVPFLKGHFNTIANLLYIISNIPNLNDDRCQYLWCILLID